LCEFATGDFGANEIGFLMRFKFSVISVIAVLMLAVAPVVAPQVFVRSAFAATVSNIVINGNQRVENETILSYMQLGVGDQFDGEKIDDSIKVLFNTGLFRDVAVRQQGSALVVSVTENPLVNIVNFEGNSDIDDKTLAKEVEVRERMIFTKARVSSDNRRIIDLYQKKGFYNVVVTPKLIQLSENRINLVFEIDEGGKTRIRNIAFEGNNAFSDGQLRDVVATKEYAFWRFLSRNTTYDADRLEFDKESLRRYYLKNGFADIQIVSADAQEAAGGDGIDVVITVEEGQRYTIADVAVAVGDANLEASRLQSVVRTGVGDRFDATKMDVSAEKLTLEAMEQGYVFAKVEPKVDRLDSGNQLNITYEITEGTRAYVERIEITGNYRTLDEVIRRELLIFEGDAFNRTLIERARRRLTALDYFDRVDFREEEGSAPDKVILVVDVAEKSTGSLTLSGGYSSVEGVIGSVGLAERNLFGRGWQTKINTSLSFKKQTIDFSFTEPYFLGMPISAGFDIFANQSEALTGSDYESKQYGGALRTGFRLDEFSSLSLKYYLAHREVSGIDLPTSAPAIIAEEGESWKSSVGAIYTYDDLDSPARPTTGLRAQLEAEVAGLGGDAQYGKVEARGWYFLPVYEDQVVLKLEASVGHIEPFGNDVPLADRFYKGGDSFRGFARSGIGPHQIGNDGKYDSIGGQTYALGTVEMNFPVGLPETWGIEGTVFSDFGTVFNAVDSSSAAGSNGCTWAPGCDVLDSMKLRASVGAGIIWTSPFGPLRFEVAYPILKQKGDDTEWFQFSIGTRF
jgi:outer membrane protein insertion porin family